MPRIALVTPILPIPHDATRGRFIHETARGLARLADVRVFFEQMQYPLSSIISPASYIQGTVGANYAVDGIDVEPFIYTGLPVISRPFNGYVAARQLLPRLRRFKPDLVLAYWVYPDGEAARYAARTLGVPVVVGALGTDIHVRNRLNTWLTRRTIQNVDAVLTVSEDMRGVVIRDYGASPERVHTVINGINTAVFYPRSQADMRGHLGIPLDARLLVYVGRFVVAKGLNELLSAFERLHARDAKTRLALVGDGVMRAELFAQIAQRGLTPSVFAPGGLEPEGVAQWIGAADLLTLPSWSEGYPNAVVEAIACGCPVVATDVGGTREIVNDSNGMLIAPRNVDILTDALQAVLERDWDHAAIAAAVRRTWDDVASDTLSVCNGVLEKAGRAHALPR